MACSPTTMSKKRFPPVAAIVVALVSVIGMIVAGGDPWLALGMGFLWAGSLWLTMPEPEQPVLRVDAIRVSRDAVNETIEDRKSVV